MNSDETKARASLDEEENREVDPVEWKKAREVVQFLGKAFSLVKVYPDDNPAVENSIRIFIEKLKIFLQEYGELKISIHEFSFSFEGEVVFQDEEKKKSLPFLFYKDGMRELSFHEGVQDEELRGFLDIVKENSRLPAEESDIVNAFWERDYPHIHYFAIDEFLESDIGGIGEENGFLFNKQELSEGVIQLTPEDIQEIDKRKRTLGVYEAEEAEKKQQSDSSLVSQLASITEGEIPELEYMLSNSREPTRLTELVTLLFEILFLEEKREQFSATLNVLEQCHQEALYKADFSLVSSILTRVEELRSIISSDSREKHELLEALVAKLRSENTISILKEVFFKGKVADYDSFFQYLKLVGTRVIPVIGDIWGSFQDPFVSLKASQVLDELGREDLDSLVRLAHNDNVTLTREIIEILVRIGGKRIVPYLENFVKHENKTVLIDTIQALGRIDDESAGRVLWKFISNEDEEVRTIALMNLRYSGNRTTLKSVLNLAQDKDFSKKKVTEKKAILNFLARTREEEVCEFFQSMLRKSSLLSKTKQDETRLCVISALELIGTPEAGQILSEAALLKSKVLSQASQLALRKMAARSNSQTGLKGEHRV